MELRPLFLIALCALSSAAFAVDDLDVFGLSSRDQPNPLLFNGYQLSHDGTPGSGTGFEYDSSFGLKNNDSPSNPTNQYVIASAGGEEFKLESIELDWTSGQRTLTLQGYRDGMQVVSEPLAEISEAIDTISPSSVEFENVDEVRLVNESASPDYFVVYLRAVDVSPAVGGDTTPPAVSSIAVSGSPSASATSVDFLVAFDENANNVSSDDFSLTATATASGSISSVSASSGSTVTVTVGSVSGSGTLRLDLNSGTNISDDAGNAGVAAYNSGSAHSVDRVAPVFENSTPSLSGTDHQGSTLSVDLDEEGKGYYVVLADGEAAPTAAQVKAGQNGSSSAALFSGTLTTASTLASANISGLNASTAYDFYVVAEDTLSPSNLQASPTKLDVTTSAPPDLTPPSVTLSGASGTINDPFTLSVTFSESVTGFVVGDLQLSNASISNFTGSGASYSATITPTTDGPVTVDLPSGVALDGASNGNTAATQLALTYDGTPPVAPTGLDLTAASDSGNSDSDNLTQLTSLVITGTGETGATVTLFADLNNNLALDGGEPSTSGLVSGGNWSLNLGGLSEGQWSLRATQADEAGNVSAVSPGLAVTLDTTAPSGHSVNLEDDPLNQGNAQTSGFSFSSAEVGAGFSYSISSSGGGSAISGSGTLASDQDSVSPMDLSVLPDGTLTLSVVLTDAAGNASTAVVDTALKDTAAPSGYGVAIDPAVVNAANVTAFSFTLSGAEVGSSYRYEISDGGASPVSGQGSVTSSAQTVSGIDVSSLSEGTLTLSLTLTDSNNNQGASTGDTVLKDAVGPQVTSVSLSSGTLKAGDSIEVRAALDDVIFLSGTNSVARLTLGSTSRTAQLVSGHNSNELVFSYQVQSGDNDDDGVTVTAIDTQGDTAEDGNGNPAQLSFSAVTETGLLVDTLAPAAPSAAQSAQTLNADTLTLSQQGYAENGVQILLLADANADGIADSDAALATATVVAGDWSLEATLSQDGDNHFVLRAQDEVGNYSDAAIGSFLEDSTVPVSPVLVSPVEDTYQITTALTLSGSHSEDGVRVLLLADADNNGVADNETALETATVSGGSWQFALTLAQNSATHLVAVAEDDAGNRSAPVALPTLVHDSIAPVAQMEAQLTNDNTPSLTGTLVEAGGMESMSIRLLHSDGGVYGPFTPNTLSDSAWSLAATADNLEDGSYNVELALEDKAGNTKVESLDAQLVVDTQAPEQYGVTIEQQRIHAYNQGAMSFLLEGGSAGEQYAYSIEDGLGGTVSASGALAQTDQAFADIDVSALAQGTLTLTFILTDEAGNQGEGATDEVLKQYNLAPQLSGTPAVSVEEDSAYSFSPGLSDDDSFDSHSFSISGLPAWASFDVASGRLWGTPTNEHVGSHGGITITVADAAGASASIGPFTITVVNSNDAPVLSGSPVTSVDEDSAYSFTPTLSDPDSGDSHSFSISGLPAWASFDASSGRLSGTPKDEHVGSHSGITISVTDAAGAADSLGPFVITVVNSNDAPMVAGLALTTEEDTALILSLPQVDQEGDSLSYRLDAEPSAGRLSENGGLWHYTPNQDFNGQDSLHLIASDGKLESEPFVVSIEVTPVNDAPVAVDDTITLAANAQGRYPLLVLENDSDVDGDPLTLVSAQSSLGQLTIEAQLLTLDLEPGFGGEVVLSYLVADEEGETANATVALSVGDGELEGLPELTPPEPVEVNADALFTRVDLGVAKAVDASGEPLPVSLVQGEPLLRPGVHQVYWQTQDGRGNSATASQLVKVHPMVNLHKDQSAAEGSEVTIALSLNGDAVTYPLELPFTLSGTAEQGVDYQLETDRFVVTSGRYAEVTLTIFADEQSEQDETVGLTLDPALNLGHKGHVTLTISDGNLAPQLALSATQSSENRTLIAQDAGPVVILASAEDPNPQDALTLTWESGELTDEDSDPASFTLDPQSLAPGDYRLEVTVSDGALSTREGLTLQLVSSLVPLGEEDSDGDLLPDSHEGYGDSDNDGIPDYLDALEQCHLQPEELQVQQQYLFEGEEGVCLRAGTLASEGQRRSVWVDEQDPLPEDEGYLAEGGTFDFIAEGLPEAGQSYRLVLPQRAPIPAGAIYRKYSPQLGWYQFVEQQGDAIHSAPGEPGYCPPPGAPQWQSGLREGAWCVQLTISDGGPNDADGRVDGNIHDPGGVAVSVNGNSSPSVVTQLVTLERDSLTRFDPLSKAQDPDGDALEMVWALADLGQVNVEPDGALVYRPPAGYLGDDRIRFLISDGRGGSTQGSIELTLVANGAPVALADYLESDDLTEIMVDVLANDSDPDGDLLLLEWVEAQVGQASITDDNRLRYRPKPGYEGEDRVTYQVRDPLGATAQSQLVLTLNANEELKVSESSGGALGWGALMGLIALMFRRGVWVAMLLPLAAQAQWRVHLQGGYSQGDSDSASIRQSLEQAGVTLSQLSVDDTAVSWGVGLGYDLTPRWQVRLDYQDLGDYELNYAGTALDPDQALKAAAGSGPKSAQGVALGVHYQWPLGTHWGLSLGGGGWYWEGESVSQSQLKRYRVDADGTDWFGEVGVSYRLQQQWQLSGGWQHFELDSDRIGNGFVRLEYRF